MSISPGTLLMSKGQFTLMNRIKIHDDGAWGYVDRSGIFGPEKGDLLIVVAMTRAGYRPVFGGDPTELLCSYVIAPGAVGWLATAHDHREIQAGTWTLEEITP